MISSPKEKGGVSGGEEGYNNVASAMFRFATSGNFTSHLAGENAGVISRARSGRSLGNGKYGEHEFP